MTIIKKPEAAPKPKRRLDLSDIKEALRDQRIWAAFGVVVDNDNDGTHFEIDSDEGDILVEVELIPSEEQLTCRLGAIAGGSGRGVWAIPPVGTEVAVLVPEGAVDGEPIIVATLSSGSLVSTEGVSENRTIIINDEVLIHDGSGGAVSLATKEDVETLRGELNSHTHTTTATVSSGSPGVISAPDQAPFTAPSGTDVLKAK